jgi:hypothetical protein
MDEDPIEEAIYFESELWGEHPQIPQWEAVAEEVICDTTEVSSAYPQRPAFYEDLEVGYI